MLKAERSLRSGNWQEALWEANTAIAADPRLLPAYYIRAAIELQAQRLGDAMRSYSEILRLNPAAVDAKVALSRLHVARNEADSGVLYAEEALRNAPEDLDARLALIRAWLARGDDSLAHAEITRLMQDSRRSAELLTLAGALHVKRGEVAAARRAFERALQIDPAAREALTALTTVDVNSRNVVRARRRVEAALTRSENDPQLLLLAAKVALIEKKFDHAESLLSRGLNADNLPTEGFVLLARLLRGERRLASAVARFDQLAASDPRNLSLRLMAAVAEHTDGNLATAEERYRAILALDPKSPLAANNLASIFVERGEHLDYAEQLATTALTQLPDAEVFDTLGSVQAKRLMFGQAAKSFERAVALRPDNAQFHYRLGLVYLALSDGARAKATLDRAVRLDPQLANASRDALASMQTP
jgi:tetratricopeptide (TPR) repeat protein